VRFEEERAKWSAGSQVKTRTRQRVGEPNGFSDGIRVQGCKSVKSAEVRDI
jgi:hypothetical protein